ncbi:leucine-rich repeat protein [Histomonas meleagridis]|nr:leucine-rich repeat protein [Histomonas meleagridis]
MSFLVKLKIKLTLRQGMRTNETEERDVRKRVNEIFTTGNLTGYGRENDLHTDYEKSVAIWWWIKENVEYGFSKRMENSAYGGIILGKAVDHGYSAMSGILLQRAGVEVRCLMGLLAKKKRFHAWNWLHIGEEWFAYDSTSSNAGNFLMGINTTNHLSQYKYSDGEYWDFPVSTSNYNYKFNSFSFPKNAPLLYQKEDTDSGLIGRNLKWTLKNGLLTIKGRGPMRNFENATQVPWKNFFYKILKLKIEETVTTIGDYAFYNIDKIKYQNYKDKLGFIQSIGQKAFSDYNDHVKTQVSYKIINLTFLDENEKENYKAQIVNASTLDKINEILLKAENKSKENENTQKTSAKDTIKKLPYLKSDSVKDFEEEINKAKDKESIKEVVTKAQSKNKELKVVFEKRETVKEEIKKS